MRVVVDTNVILDVALNRHPWAIEARQIWNANQSGLIEAHLVATTITTVFYVGRRTLGTNVARVAVGHLLTSFSVLAVDRDRLQDADALHGADLEDNLISACAVAAGVDAIITRDASGFAGAAVPVWTPTELLARISGTP